MEYIICIHITNSYFNKLGKKGQKEILTTKVGGKGGRDQDFLKWLTTKKIYIFYVFPKGKPQKKVIFF